MVVKGALLLPAASTIGNVCCTWAKLFGSKMLRVPACAGIELVDEIRAEDMRVTRHQRALRLRRIRIEHRIDRIGVCGLQARVLLKPVPDAVVAIDGVVDLHHNQILAVAVVQRLLALVGAAASIKEVPARLRARQQRAVASSGQELTATGVPAVLR